MKKFIIQDDYDGVWSYECLQNIMETFPEIIVNPNIPYVEFANHNSDYSSYNNEFVEDLYEYLVNILMQDDDEDEYDDDCYHITYDKSQFIIKDIKNEYGIELSWSGISALFTPKLSKENNCINLTEDDMYDFIGNILMRALALKYQAGNYESTYIYGCVQGECLNVLYPETFECVIKSIEATVFNTGEEVHIIDDYNDEDYWDYMPIPIASDKEIKKYVRDSFGAEDGDEIIYMEQEHRIIDVEKKRVTIV